MTAEPADITDLPTLLDVANHLADGTSVEIINYRIGAIRGLSAEPRTQDAINLCHAADYGHPDRPATSQTGLRRHPGITASGHRLPGRL